MRTQQHIVDCLRGTDSHSKIALDRLVQSTRVNDKVAWYPSSDEDYRDVLECGTQRHEEHGFNGRPGLYVHTDLNRHRAQVYAAGSELRNDGRTRVICISSHRMRLAAVYRSEAISSWRGHQHQPEIPCALSEIQVESNKYGTVRAWVLSICIDNHVFLNDFLIPLQIQLSHVIKVREAPQMSSDHGVQHQLSITQGFVYLGVLGVQWILADGLLASVNDRGVQIIEPRHFCHEYDIQSTGEPFKWSGLAVTPYSVRLRSVSAGDVAIQ
ncbi:MAG: hypothetical protein IPF79_08990 [Ignavibacteria bacterium]|nr:hypothetical protein [Ignavibacteria bacterium]